jgi:anthranilate 1,2-dioxygenase ferredoxin subunit
MSAPADLVLLCSIQDVSEDEPLRVEVGGTAYAVFQSGADFHVTEDLCSHGPGSLSEGFLVGCEVVCPFHQGRFDIRTGRPTHPPCEVPIRVWEAIVRDGEIFIAEGSPKDA